MKITKLRLKNFRSHKDTSLELDRLNFFFGQNRSGKSSLQMAIEFLLSGLCQVTDAGGRGAEDLIRFGEKQLEVAASIDGIGEVVRRKSSKGHTLEVGGVLVPVSVSESNLYAKVGATSAVLSAVVNSGNFVGMSGKDQRAFLAAALGKPKVTVSEEAAAAWREIFQAAIPGLESVKDLEAAYDSAYAKRREIGQELKGLGPEPAVDASQEPVPDEGRVREKLNGLRRDKENLVAQRAAEQGSWRASQDEIAALSREKVGLENAMLSEQEAERLNQAIKCRPERERLEKEIAALETEKRLAEHNIQKLGTMGKQCGVVEEIECPLEGSQLVKIGQSTAERKEKAGAKIQKLQTKLDALASEGDADRRIAEHRMALKRAGEVEDRLMELKKRKAPDTESLEEEIGNLGDRILNGDSVLARVARLHAQQEEVKRWKSRKGEMEHRHALAEKLVAYFGPDGVRKEALGDTLGPFRDRLNAHLKAFAYNADFSLEPYRFTVRCGEAPLELKQLSESEVYRFSVAFQIALAGATGVQFAVVDRADILDESSRRALVEILSSSGLEQALVMSTRDNATGLPEAPRGVKFFWLERQGEVSVATEIGTRVEAR